MEDCCAVCAEPLEWVAYGPCGHRDVCATCIMRLRFICSDRRCCICKSYSDCVFVTKALGQYTRIIADFDAEFAKDAKEGQVGEFWYYAGAEAYFDDVEEYKMVKAMCRLSCNVCHKKDDQRRRGGGEFGSIEQLKGHLFHRHKLFMCSLCLEGRKVFVSEQKLYNREQLSQHVRSGDSVVDGSENDRAGFMGHPKCEFCQSPFYGDNELYLHMSTEHFTCHICQRQHPGQYEYFESYDNLEIHFRQEHFLCEDEACLAKKFIVFTTESEMKRHNAMEHGGRMSRFKRSAALQIPTSFQFRRRNEGEQRGSSSGDRSDGSDYQLAMAIQESLDTANAVRSPDAPPRNQRISSLRGTSETESIANPFESLGTSHMEPSSRHHQFCEQNFVSATLEESSFPPLPAALRSSQRSRIGGGRNTMAARLRHRNTVKVLNYSRASREASHHPCMSATISYQSRPFSEPRLTSSSSSVSSTKSKRATVSEYVVPSPASASLSRPSTADGLVSSSNFESSSRASCSTSKAGQSTSRLHQNERDKPISSVPPISSPPMQNMPTSNQPLPIEDVQSANKALVEKIRLALEFDEDKYSVFKIISADYRRDLIDTSEYLAYVHQFGLSHLILELARLCPNVQKQRELVELYNYNMRRNVSNENGFNTDSGQAKKSGKKGKEKCEDNAICSSENSSSAALSGILMKFQSNSMPSREEMGNLPKDCHSSARGKAKLLVDGLAKLNLSTDCESTNDAQSGCGGSKKNVGAGGGGNKPRKKASKFLRNRLGDDSAVAFADAGNSDTLPDEHGESTGGNNDPSKLLPIGGVWRNGGGQRLVAMTQRDRKK